MADGVIQLTPVVAERTWLDFEHHDFRALQGRINFTYDHYTGDVVDPEKIQTYLRKRSLGESALAYKERCDLADYTNHFAAIVDSIAGMLFAVEGDANRILNKSNSVNGKAKVTTVLGEFNQSNTIMGRLFLDADGSGNGYISIWKTLATELLSLHRAWVLVDGDDGNAKIKIFPFLSVPNWRYDKDGLAEVIVKEKTDGRNSLREQYENAQKTRYLYFNRDGWERWEKDKEGKDTLLGFGTHTFIDRNRKRALPIFPINLPLRRMVGWQLAVKSNRIFNKESERDHLLRLANSPKLNLIAGDALFEKIVTALEQGSNALQNDPDAKLAHDYIAPSSEPAQILSQVIERKVEELWISAFRMYGDSAKEKTATEARQDVSQGVGAFLHILKAAIDGAENEALWRIEQIHYPRNRDFWYTARVERSDDFLPTNVDAAIEKIRERYFGKGGTVPVGRSTLISAIQTMLSWDGLTMTDEEIEASVDAHMLERSFEAINGKAELPAEALIQHMLKVFLAAGLIDKMPTENEKDSIVEKLKKEIQKGADARAEKPASKLAYQGVDTDGRRTPAE